jgi:hypothetical protein
MENRVRHLLHDTGWGWSLRNQVDDPCNPAHLITIAEDRIEKRQEMNAGDDRSSFAGAQKLWKGTCIASRKRIVWTSECAAVR